MTKVRDLDSPENNDQASDFQITILGANSALPVHGRYPSAQYIQIQGYHLLMDCGEGTQLRLREVKAKWAKINHVFISHLHGDHFFGLPGFITSMSLLGRQKPLHIYGPLGIKQVLINLFNGCGVQLNYEMIFHEIDSETSTICLDNDKFEVLTIPLDHRVATHGYLFREKPKLRNIIPAKIKEHQLTIDQIKAAKAGNNIQLPDGQTIMNDHLTLDPTPPRSYAYCSDTRYKPNITSIIHGVDLLYHEATYLHERLEMAEYSKHTTALEAGQIAKAAEVKKLMIGHYSSRYDNVTPLREEAQSVFNNTIVALNGKVVDV